MLGLNYYSSNTSTSVETTGTRGWLVSTHKNTPDQPDILPEGHGWVARYARGRDYHRVMEQKLKLLCGLIESECERSPALKYMVDYGPMLERSYAHKAGLGYIGKNSMLINRQFGSWFLLAEIITDLELEPDDPHAVNHGRCGGCGRCIDACPTGAIIADGVIDSNLCISYLTIERPSSIPDDLAAKVRLRLFGCDICQEVCPHNGRAVTTRHEDFLPSSGVGASLDAREILKIESRERYLDLTSGTPLTRPKLDGLKRNARIVLYGRDEESA